MVLALTFLAPSSGLTTLARLQAAGATSVLLELPWSEHAFDAVPFGLGGQISLHYAERFLSSVFRRDRT